MEVTGLAVAAALIALLLPAVIAEENVAQAPNYAQECAPELLDLLPCMPAVKGSGSPPSDACCSGIATILSTDPICLCYVAADAAQRNDPNINITVAMQLPALCKLNADVHGCDDFPGFPAMGPMPGMPGMPLPPMVPGGDPTAPPPSSTSRTSLNLFHLAAALLIFIYGI